MGPRMRIGREFAAAVVNGKIYVMGGCVVDNWARSMNWAEVFDPTTGLWTTLPSPIEVRDKWMHASAVVGDKIYAMADRGGVVYDVGVHGEVVCCVGRQGEGTEVDIMCAEIEVWKDEDGGLSGNILWSDMTLLFLMVPQLCIAWLLTCDDYHKQAFSVFGAFNSYSELLIYKLVFDLGQHMVLDDNGRNPQIWWLVNLKTSLSAVVTKRILKQAIFQIEVSASDSTFSARLGSCRLIPAIRFFAGSSAFQPVLDSTVRYSIFVMAILLNIVDFQAQSFMDSDMSEILGCLQTISIPS
ncbi:hypothetical protein HAX54_046677 [Datura stramonium]|uniref:FKB95-like N-terminal Kelch domain-containing protein n=1 Tax=Datura stramonium TaxID=4076 RepID=A0ABS8RPU4_DATST|nr:hypothetical protein [Datura stramonium]